MQQMSDVTALRAEASKHKVREIKKKTVITCDVW